MLPPRRLYVDNAATSFPKPPAVAEAMARYAVEIGASAGRGAYDEAVASAQILTTCRRRLNRLFNGESADHVIFTLNCTDALNIALKGLLPPLAPTRNHDPAKPHAICTHIDHNSILRPLGQLEDAGWIDVTRIPVDAETGLVDPEDLRRAITPATRVIAITHVSNVTGTIQPIRAIGQIARAHDIPFVVDAAQSAGHLPIDVRADCIDLLAAPGHKGLLGPLGTGVLYIRPGIEPRLATWREGGTGSVSETDRQPDFMPDRFEAGSHNAIGIAGLSEGVKWILDQTVAKLAAHDGDLMRTFMDGVADVQGLRYFGPQGVKHRVGVFSVAIDGYSPAELAAALESHYGILTRAGLHCAPLAHAAIGTTTAGGTVRLSFGPFLSPQDVAYAADALAEIALRTFTATN